MLKIKKSINNVRIVNKLKALFKIITTFSNLMDEKNSSRWSLEQN